MSLSLQSSNGIQVAVLNGPLDQASGTDMVTTIKSSVPKGVPLILDFTSVPQMDGGGFRQLLALKRWADQGNSRLVLAGMNEESWALVVENNCTNTFESKPSLPAAVQALGAAGGADTAPDYGAAPADDDASFGGFEGIPEADSGVFSSPPPLPSGGDAWNMPSSAAEAAPSSWGQPANEEGWDKFDRGSRSEGGSTTENEHRGKSRKGLYIGLAAAAVVIIGLGGYWLLDFFKNPEIRVDETSLEVPSGKELPALSIWVKNGVLSGSDGELPAGVEIVEGEESQGEKEYLLTGSPKKAGTYEIIITAERENNPARKSPAATIELIVTEVKLEWQKDEKGGLPLNSAGLVDKKALPTNSISTVVTGAKALSMEWQGSPLGGVSVARVPNTETSWQLTGMPQNPGTFRALFVATKVSGETESQTFELVVGAIPPPPPPAPVPVPQPDPAMPVVKTDGKPQKPAGDGVATLPPAKDEKNMTQPPPPVPEADPKADEKMRGFLLERIEKANSHFTDEEKTQLRMVVNTLKEARLIGTVHFKSNSSEISRFEKEKLVESLEEPALKKLLEDEDCQILIVGYADKTGKLSHNIKLSKQRAREVDLLLKKQSGRRADLCGDYGPTDLISENAADNRVVEVYAGTIEISGLLENVADKFKEDFNKRHGLR